MAAPLTFSLGFLIGPAVIYLAGIGIGQLTATHIQDGMQTLRYVGVGIAGIGVYIVQILVKF